jgi:hypothetical protein
LTSLNIEAAALVLDPECPSKDQGIFIELRGLGGLDPASGASHVGDADGVLPVLTRPTYSSMSFGLLPAAVIRVGFSIRVGIATSVEPVQLRAYHGQNRQGSS